MANSSRSNYPLAAEICRRDAFGKGDYWLLDENWGRYRQELEIQNLNLLQPHIVKSLQALLADLPNWYITARVDVPGKEKIWPGMGVIIYPDEIVDELQSTQLSERQGRLIDFDQVASMERKKQEGYF